MREATLRGRETTISKILLCVILTALYSKDKIKINRIVLQYNGIYFAATWDFSPSFCF